MRAAGKAILTILVVLASQQGRAQTPSANRTNMPDDLTAASSCVSMGPLRVACATRGKDRSLLVNSQTWAKWSG